jgi:hypothetical protein
MKEPRGIAYRTMSFVVSVLGTLGFIFLVWRGCNLLSG